MMLTKETTYTKGSDNKSLLVVREFDAPVEKVWRAWTEREMLDQWWAPKPWKAVTQSLNFTEGGDWLYFMEGPDGTRHYCKVAYQSIDKKNSFSGDDAFCDEKGNINKEFPVMHWKVEFKSAGETTKVQVTVSFDSEEDMNKIVEMGFKEGFAAAHGNLDELLAKQ